MHRWKFGKEDNWVLNRIFLTILVVILCNPCYSQSGDNAPIVYDQFFRNYFLVNPSLLSEENRADFILGNRTLTGLFEGVNRFYADANFLIQSKKENRFHSIGFQAMNNRDGEYFSRTRAYLRYSWYTSLSDRAAVSAGAAGGIINYSFKASPASGGGSSFAPDGNIGVWYLREHLKVGMSYFQFSKPVLRPVNQEFRLDSYFNFNVIYKLIFSEQLYMESNFYLKYQRLLPFQLELAPVLTIYDKVDMGINFRQNIGIAFLGGIRNIHLRNNKFRFMVSYLINTQKVTNVNAGVLEFSFGYSLPY